MTAASRSGNEHCEVVIVGAGQAGLAVSWYLRLFGIDHVVLERGRVGESWRSARWDSFTLVTPAWMTRLPGLVQPPGSGQEFTGRDRFVALLDSYSADLPVRCGVEVLSVRAAGQGYRLVTTSGTFAARAVVAASGMQRRPVIPPGAGSLPETVLQLHASQYRHPEALPAGAALVVGSGQSGAQIAEELGRAGRRVYLATSRVGRAPRRYRGRDAHDWAQDMGLDDRTPEQVPAEELHAAHPLLSGARGGHTVALQQLARDGVTLLGRFLDVNGATVRLGDDLVDNIRHGDDTAAAFRRAVDEHIAANSLHAPAGEPDPAERPLPHPVAGPRQLDVAAQDITTVIWCVGFGPDTAWIHLPVLDHRGAVLSNGGVTAAPGLYTLGGPWLTHRGSGILYGVGSDASRIARHLAAFLHARPRLSPEIRNPASPPSLAATP